MLKILARRYVKKALAYGASPYKICEELGLNPKVALKIHPLQSRILEALEQGITKPDESYYSIAQKLGVKNHGTVYHHMCRLRVAGKLAPQQPKEKEK